jgi:oligopeptidase B
MKLYFLSAALLLSCCFCTNQNKQESAMQAPKAKKIAKTLEIHGDVRTDNYYWLNERENPEVIAYLEEENAYTKHKLAHTEGLQDELYNEIVGRIKKDDNTVPYFKNGYWFYVRYEAEKEYPFVCRKKESLDAAEEVMLDVNALAQGKEYCQLGSAVVSTDGKKLAYTVDFVSRRQYQIFVKNLETGETSASTISNTAEPVIWAKDNKTLFYTKRDESLRTHQVWRATWNNGFENETLIFEEKDETFNVGIGKTKSEAFLMIHSGSTLTDEWRYVSLDKPEAELITFFARERGLEYQLDHLNGVFYIKTNWNAENFRLMKCDEKSTDKKFWKEVIAHRNSVLLEDIELYTKYLVVEERENGLINFNICDLNGKSIKKVPFTENVYTASIANNPDPNSPYLRYSYTSLTTPSSVIDYYLETGESQLKKEQEVEGGYDKNQYFSERIWAKAEDGTEVPLSIVYKKALFEKGKNPALIYGYGSYGYSMDVYFSASRLSLLDRGFVFAIAHIRGGEDLGRNWYENGKLLKKKNTFTDFVACSKHLIIEEFCHAQKLFAMGGSAGGLLMGAVINMAPELYRGVIAAVPFVDVVTTMLDESIPLTTGEFDEWGNPKNEEYYHYMKSYSPYDNIEAKAYPNMLVTTGLHDSQVQYWEPAKWVAKLRELKTDDNLLLLYTNMSAGHGGASGRFRIHRETAMEYSFLIDLAK